MGLNTIVTGGAGFIGSNYVSRLLDRGDDVKIFDNLSRKGANLNIEWLQKKYGKDAFELIIGDVRDREKVISSLNSADVIVHLAGQVAVTTSVLDPIEDFEINAMGTFNVLEAARQSGKKPIVLYSSTNKVYGGMEDVVVEEGDTTYYYKDFPLGLSEDQNLDFHSPYGCSKGSGDQYMRDYFRIYDIPTVVFRQSCIYGPRQFGVEDQGWVAWFIIAAVTGKPISIYGDGKQVRDILYVSDLLNAYDLAIKKIDKAAGKIYNIGGGSKQTMSIWKEFGPILEELLGQKISITKDDWRPGDQKVYISDITKAQKELGWNPEIGVREGVSKLYNWVVGNKTLFTGN
ncbi:MAG: GDP-mannose 4,6-dehydratase [Anaerolineaceae bacterium]|nr:GDP-mannose 4,6-dehydratase [Anaerolineaceae bacterium]